jgi:hypothetical protein
MIFANNKKLRRRGIVAIAAAVFTVFALVGSSPAQTPLSPEPPESCIPGEIVNFCIEIPSDLPPARGFLFDQGVYRTFVVPGAVVTNILGINNCGQMVDVFVDAQGMLHAFLRDERGTITEIDHPDAPPPSGAPSPFGISPFGINEQGQIVGAFR